MAAMPDEDLAKLTPVEFVRGLKQTVLFQDSEYRLTLCEYQSILAPDLFIEFLDEEGDWNSQIPLPIDAERARAIAAGLIAWADSQVEDRRRRIAAYGGDAVDEAETFAHYADDPASNRFDSVEISGIVEPIGVDS
jgi:hypothetical protein